MFVLLAPNTRSNQSSTSPRSGAWTLGWYIFVIRNLPGVAPAPLVALSDMLSSLFGRLPRFRTRDAKVLAQGPAGVIPPEQALLVPLGHQQPDELLAGAGQVRGPDDAPVAGARG